MNGHPIENMMETTLENIRNMVDVNTIVGDTVVMGDGTVIIPISKVSFGFVAGGGEYGSGQGQQQGGQGQGGAYPFAGGTGAGVSICPMAFLVVSEGEVNLLPVQFNNTYERVIERIPDLLCQVRDAFRSKEHSHGNAAEGRGRSRPFMHQGETRDGTADIPNGAQDPNVRPPKDEL